jgi:signal transduction histidine kinase/CheY-like chemotaxis protein
MQPQTRWSRFRTSFQFKLFFIFTLITFLISLLLTVLYITREIETTRHDTATQLELRTANLAESIQLPLYAHNLNALRMLAEQAAKTPEIRTVEIFAPDGTTLVKVQGDAEKASASSDSIIHTDEVRSSPLASSVEESLAGAINTATSLLGKVSIERSTDDLSRAIRRILLFSSVVAVFFWLTVTLFSYLILKKLIRSFNALMHGIKVMQEGDFTARIPIESDDEPARAARAINRLAEMLQIRGEENSRLQEERLHLERQALHSQKLESLGVMAGGIAHDFNNLLQSILGNMELATMKLDSNSAPRKYIDNAMNAAKRAALLTNLMLTYVGKGLISRKELNLNELVQENANVVKTAAATTVSTELHLSPALPFILADEAHIHQLVMNLITNAAEAITGPSGTVRLTTGVQECDQAFLNNSLLEEKPEAGRYVFLEVSDDGCGMSEETLRRLFDPFFSTKFTGRGLGMSAVLGIMKTHCGALYVESNQGTGTIFRVLFPAADSTVPTPVVTTTVAAPVREVTEVSSMSGLVLVVDDEKSVLRVSTKMILLYGFSVITAADGLEAVAKFRKHADEITFVLMDLTMPHMDGIAAMNELHLIRPDTKVILASGFNEDELSDRITGRPPAGFIRKPFSMAALGTEIRRVLEERH